MSGDFLPTVVGIVLVAMVAAFALLPLLRGTSEQLVPVTTTSDNPASLERFELYRQVLELEFDYRVGKLAQADYEQLTAELLARAGSLLRDERASAPAGVGPGLDELDEEIEREIAAARKALAAAGRRRPGRAARPAGTRS